MIASNQTLWKMKPVNPMILRAKAFGMTYGVGPAGIDLRIREDVVIPEGGFKLASCTEEFRMPKNLLGVVHDKSTWARLGLCVQNTVIEPGWRGYLTIELTNHNRTPWYKFTGRKTLRIRAGTPICQIVFHILDEETEQPYTGKYQYQKEGIQEAILEPNTQAQCR